MNSVKGQMLKCERNSLEARIRILSTQSEKEETMGGKIINFGSRQMRVV